MIQELLTEKLRPKELRHMILPERIRKQFEGGLQQNVLLAGSPGLGKTSIAKILAAKHPTLFVNVSDESSVETIRTKISDFCATASVMSEPNSKKVVILDECLSIEERVRIGTTDYWEAIALKDLEFETMYACVSMNPETGFLENDICYIVSEREAEIFEVELENGKKIHVTSNHPFMIQTENGIEQKSIDGGLSIVHQVFVFDSLSGNSQKIISITQSGTGQVRNLSVEKNHTFLTENGICTHNCDGASDQFYKALRGTMEKFASNTRFIGTCNWINKVPEAVQSRFEVVNFDPSNHEEEQTMRTEWRNRISLILGKMSISIDDGGLDEFTKLYFPDFRSALNKIQSLKIAGISEINAKNIKDFGWSYEDLYQMMVGTPDPVKNYQYVVSNYSGKIDEVMASIGGEFLEWLTNRHPDKTKYIPSIVVETANHQAQRNLVIDPVVSLLSLVFTIQKIFLG
jgi:DNA polymerase III delta prime subunit